jgi:hypothetical protein
MSAYDIAIVGAGPSGILAAISAAEHHASVILLDKNKHIGRKILATGNGRCNITNRDINTSRYHGKSPKFVETVFDQLTGQQTQVFFESIGVILKEEDCGRLFPRTNQASTVVDALEHKLLDLRVDVRTNFNVKGIQNKNGWEVIPENGQKAIHSQKIIITTGGRAAHQFGSSGDGLFWLKNLGHTIEPIYASLVPLETMETWPNDIQGLKIKARVYSIVNNKKVTEKNGDLLFTHYGLSGPAIMGIARDLSDEKKNNFVEIDLIPDFDNKKLLEKINLIFEQSGSKSILNNLLGFLPRNLLIQALKRNNLDQNIKSAETSRAQRQEIVRALKCLRLKVKKLRPLKEAQVTRGGIDTSEVDNHSLESLLFPGLYFAGEILDIDADSGGYNLQWAWSSGYVAGLHAANNN